MTTSQHKDTTLDSVITQLRAGRDPDTKQLHITEEEAKQALLQWRDKAVVKAVENIKSIIKMSDTYTFNTGEVFIKETPNED